MITLTELRNDIYNKVGNVISTGQPIDIDYKGRIVRIVAADAPSKLSYFSSEKEAGRDEKSLTCSALVSSSGKLARLKSHPEAIAGDPEDLINVNRYEYGVLDILHKSF